VISTVARRKYMFVAGCFALLTGTSPGAIRSI